MNAPVGAQLPSAKRSRATPFFSYYAGFSDAFVRHCIERSRAPHRDLLVMDPWNGSGTTTAIANTLGVRAIGLDLNPAMTVVARARLAPKSVSDQLLGRALFTRRKPTNLTPNDPLLDWFYPSTAELLRQAADELGLNSVAADTLDTQSCVAAVSLFKTTRGLLSRFQTSNPTWMRAPRHHAERVRASRSDISKEFTAHLRKLIDGLNGPEKQLAAVRTADARFGPLSATQVDLVLGSPPYCTRIDYAKATQVELATMGIADADFRSLRNRLSGTTSIKGRDANESTLPPLIETLLADIKAHPSHGSATYYHPTIRGYFEDIKLCMKAIAAGLAPNGRVILVVQDSYYKEMRIPIQEAFELLAAQVGLELRERVDESISAPKSIINRYSKKYRSRHEAIESVLSFTKGTSI